MALGTPVFIDGVNNSTPSTSTVLTVPGGGVPAGAQIVVSWAGDVGGSAHSCTDTAGNTYVIDQTDPDHATGNLESVFFRASNVLALAASDTITISWTATAVNSAIAAYVTGVKDTLPLDQKNTGEGTDDPVDSGNITTTQADEVLFGALTYDAVGSRTITEDADFTLLGNLGGAVGRQNHLAYRIVSATETNNYVPSGLDPSDEWHCQVLSYFASIGVDEWYVSFNEPVLVKEPINISSGNVLTEEDLVATAVDAASILQPSPYWDRRFAVA